MAVILPKFGTKVPSETTMFADLGRELREMGQSIESVLASFNYNGADPNLMASRVAALEAWRTAASTRLSDLEAASAITNPETVFTGGTKGANHLVTKVGRLVIVNLHTTRTAGFPASGGIGWLPAPKVPQRPLAAWYGSGQAGHLVLSASGQLATDSAMPVSNATTIYASFSYEAAP